MVRALLIVNPQATATTRGGRDVLAHALASRMRLRVEYTGHGGHATDLATGAGRDGALGVDLVIAHGGDGTVSEVVTGILRAPTPPALAVVPGGAANVFARALGIPTDPMEATHQLLQALQDGRSRTVGLGKADGRWFTCNAGLGWDADVVAAVDRMRRKRTSQTLYTGMALVHYMRLALHGPSLTIEIPGLAPISGLRTAFVSNSDPWSYLGERPIRLNPRCSFDTGLGLSALRTMWAPVVLRHVTQALRRKPDPRGRSLIRSDDVSLIRVSSDRPVRFQIDGDYIGRRTRVDFKAVHDALRVIA